MSDGRALAILLFMILMISTSPIPYTKAQPNPNWTFERVDSTSNIGMYTSLALDVSGNPRISYYASGGLKYASRSGGVWMLETVDFTGGNYPGLYHTRQLTSLTLDASGNPHISYTNFTCRYGSHCDRFDRDLRYASKSGGIWTLETVDTSGYTAFNISRVIGQYSSLAIDASGNPHIIYLNVTYTYCALECQLSIDADLRYAAKSGGEWTLETVDTSGYTAHGSLLTLDASGMPHIAYTVYTNMSGNLRYAVKSGGIWTLETVDDTGVTSSPFSLVLDASGTPHIAYFAGTGDLRYASKSNGVWIIETVDSPDLGYVNTLAIDAGGNPHIIYIIHTSDYYEGLLYAVRVGSAGDCPGNPAWNCETIDSGVTYSGERYSSLALDASGTPHISYSYYDGDGDVLTYAFRSPDVTPPLAPELLVPSDGSVTNDNTPIFDWNDISDNNLVTYSLQVDNSPDFTSPELNAANIHFSYYAPSSQLPDGVYYWRVRAVDGAGNIGDYSTPYTLTVETTPTPITPSTLILAILTAIVLPILRRRRPR